jgi:hypothetical protein
MKPETKLWLRKKALMALRSLLWHADEWLHVQELKLRKNLSDRKEVPIPVAPCDWETATARTCLTSDSVRVRERNLYAMGSAAQRHRRCQQERGAPPSALIRRGIRFEVRELRRG